VLGLIGLNYQVFLLEDCLFSEEPHVGPAIRRMEAAGAIPTTVKTFAYELRLSVEQPTLSQLLEQRGSAATLSEPEALPDWRPTR
jgi:hypothetical protein